MLLVSARVCGGLLGWADCTASAQLWDQTSALLGEGGRVDGWVVRACSGLRVHGSSGEWVCGWEARALVGELFSLFSACCWLLLVGEFCMAYMWHLRLPHRLSLLPTRAPSSFHLTIEMRISRSGCAPLAPAGWRLFRIPCLLDGDPWG